MTRNDFIKDMSLIQRLVDWFRNGKVPVIRLSSYYNVGTNVLNDDHRKYIISDIKKLSLDRIAKDDRLRRKIEKRDMYLSSLDNFTQLGCS